MATATKRVQRTRPVAPKATTPAEVPATPAPAPASEPSIWTRVKTAAKKTAAVVAKPFKAAAKIVTRSAKAVASKTKAVVVKIRNASSVRAATGFVSMLWNRVFRMFLRAMFMGIAASVVLLGAIVAPFWTFLVVAGLGLALVGLALGVKALEEAEGTSRAARIVLAILEGIVRAGLVLSYIASAAMTLLMAVTSLPFAVFVVGACVALWYKSPMGVFAAFAAFCVLSGQWWALALWLIFFGLPVAKHEDAEVPEYSEIRRKPEAHENVVRRTESDHERDIVERYNEARRQGWSHEEALRDRDIRPDAAPNHPELWTRGNHLVAKGTEELWGTEHDRPLVVHDDADEGRAVPVEPAGPWHEVWDNDQACSACGTTKGAMRIRSMNVPFVTAGTGKGNAAEDAHERELLCSACFTAECEDVALALTGVSIDARSVEVRLNKAGIEHSPEHAASKFDPTSFHWLESGWWRDRNGNQHAREWSCLVNGRVVASIVQDHRRKVFRASALGKVVPNGVKTSVEAAKRAAEDELSDEANAVERHVEAADAVAPEQRSAKKA